MTKCKQELFVKGSEMFNLLGDFYLLNKAIMNGDENGVRTDEYWDRCLKLGNEFADKYPNHKRYALSLVLTLFTELEERDKAEKLLLKAVSA